MWSVGSAIGEHAQIVAPGRLAEVPMDMHLEGCLCGERVLTGEEYRPFGSVGERQGEGGLYARHTV